MLSPPSDGSAPPDEPGRAVSELAIQFSKPTNKTARGAIVRVKYESNGKTLVHRIGFEIVLCEGDSDRLAIPECQPKDYDGWEQEE